ncbi:MAG: YqgE/AlgH family protein [Gammaproteobacteria bacterium]
MSSNFLENQFLIAMPRLADSYFANTVTYLWKHNSEGALGIVINKPLTASVADIFDELEIVCRVNEGPFREQRVLAGGPVERDKGFILHDAGDDWESSIAVTSSISLCTSKTILQDIAAGSGPNNYVVALGCAGWDAGQLEREIGENAWLTVPADPKLIFSKDYESKADEAAASLGISLHSLSPDAGHS